MPRTQRPQESPSLQLAIPVVGPNRQVAQRRGRHRTKSWLRRKQLRMRLADERRELEATVVADAPSTAALALAEASGAADPGHCGTDSQRWPRKRASRTRWQRRGLRALDADASPGLGGRCTRGARSSSDVLHPLQDAADVDGPQVLMELLCAHREQESHDRPCTTNTWRHPLPTPHRKTLAQARVTERS